MLTGKLGATSLGALRRRIERARRMRGNVVLDLGEVTLVDRPALQFLAVLNDTGVQIVNCPVYIESWLRKQTV